MFPNALPSEKFAVVGTIDPAVSTADDATPRTSDWVDMADWHQMAAVVALGTMGATIGINAKLEQATDSGGSGAKDISGKAITALDGGDDNNQTWINCRADELDQANGFRFVRLSVTISDTNSPDAATAGNCALLFGVDPRYGPASDYDLASVAEIVT